MTLPRKTYSGVRVLVPDKLAWDPPAAPGYLRWAHDQVARLERFLQRQLDVYRLVCISCLRDRPLNAAHWCEECWSGRHKTAWVLK